MGTSDPHNVDFMAGVMMRPPSQMKELLNIIFSRAVHDAYSEDVFLDCPNLVYKFIKTDTRLAIKLCLVDWLLDVA